MERLAFCSAMDAALCLQAQNLTVARGTVTDEAGEAVIGATIVVVGNPSNGTITDFNDNWVLNDVPEDGKLIFSYEGMKSRAVSVECRTIVNVTMSSNTELLDEAVVVGYGMQKKANLTGSVASINADALETRPVASVSAALGGNNARSHRYPEFGSARRANRNHHNPWQKFN